MSEDRNLKRPNSHSSNTESLPRQYPPRRQKQFGGPHSSFPPSKRGSKRTGKHGYSARPQDEDLRVPEITESVKESGPDLDPVEWKRGYESQKTVFDHLKSSLLENPEYREKFVALANGNVVDLDEDKLALASRMTKRNGKKLPFFIDKVTNNREVLHLPFN